MRNIFLIITLFYSSYAFTARYDFETNIVLNVGLNNADRKRIKPKLKIKWGYNNRQEWKLKIGSYGNTNSKIDYIIFTIEIDPKSKMKRNNLFLKEFKNLLKVFPDYFSVKKHSNKQALNIKNGNSAIIDGGVLFHTYIDLENYTKTYAGSSYSIFSVLYDPQHDTYFCNITMASSLRNVKEATIAHLTGEGSDSVEFEKNKFDVPSYFLPDVEVIRFSKFLNAVITKCNVF